MPDPQVWEAPSGADFLVEPEGDKPLDPELAQIMQALGWQQLAGDPD